MQSLYITASLLETSMQDRQPFPLLPPSRRRFFAGAAAVSAGAAAVRCCRRDPAEVVAAEPARVAPEKEVATTSRRVKQYYKTTEL